MKSAGRSVKPARHANGNQLRILHKIMCGCIWTPPDCNGLFGSGVNTIANVFPASLSSPIDRRREPQWVSARYFLIAPKASVVPGQTVTGPRLRCLQHAKSAA